MIRLHRLGKYLFVSIIVSIMLSMTMTGCSPIKYLEEDEYYLQSIKVNSDDPSVSPSTLSPYVKQKVNSKWFSLVKVPMGMFCLSGKDSTKWVNRTIRRLGEKPVIYDSTLTKSSIRDMQIALRNQGYLHANVTHDTKNKGKRLSSIYTLHPGQRYTISSIEWDIQDPDVSKIIENNRRTLEVFAPGAPLSTQILNDERERITSLLNDCGYYYFNKDYITFDVDTTANSTLADVTLTLYKYNNKEKNQVASHQQYTINDVTFSGNGNTKLPLRKSVLQNSTTIKPGELYRRSSIQQTYNNLARLHAIRYSNITLTPNEDSLSLDCDIQIGMQKPSMISFQPEGTNTAGDLGAAASVTYENRNIFHGSELFSLQFRGAFEAITGLEGYNDEDYTEFNIGAKLQFPRLLAPILSRSFKSQSSASSEVALEYDMQNRPEFHRRVFSGTWRYRWENSGKRNLYRLDLLDLNYVYMPWISETFRKNYLEDDNSRNAILRYNYEDLFIMKIGLGYTRNGNNYVIRTNIETSGNLLQGLSHLCKFNVNDQGQSTLFRIAFAQYVKGDFDYSHTIKIDQRNNIALHFGLGLSYPYGNSTILPFEKRYFAGGANSVRGWSVRSLGPGKFRGSGTSIDFINHTGDMKLDLNAEYRTKLFWKFYGAVFVDAGNIWTLRKYADQPGGQFSFKEFYNQIAVAYGAGMRLDFGFFMLRLDLGIKAVNPAYTTTREHFPILHPDFGRDYALHFAVGLPF